MVDSSDLELLRNVLKEFSPEILDIYDLRRESGDEDGSKTGRQHENHILGIILGYDFKDETEGQITTTDIENEYELFFKKIARSTVSTYLNQLDKEGVLTKRRDGRTVFYLLKQKPPYNVNPFWIIRNFCILTPYFYRAIMLAKLYDIIDKKEQSNINDAIKFLIGLCILFILRNRIINCLMCQFAIKEDYREIRDEFDLNIKNRSDVLPEEIIKYLNGIAELPIFGGFNPLNENKFEEISTKLKELAERYSQDIDFQSSVAKRRRDIRLKQIEQKIKKEQEENEKKRLEREKEEKLNKIKELAKKQTKKRSTDEELDLDEEEEA
jgi:DNA-binding transcriptional ArsR family regulator